MAKFRKNHQRKGRGANQSYVTRSIVYIVLILFVLSFLFSLIKNISGTSYDTFYPQEDISSGQRFYLPTGSNGQIIHHDHYSLAYNEETEQSDWVAYILSRDELKAPNVKRSRHFYRDDQVRNKSAHHKDYSHSGYTRGHMVPAGDMAFDEEAMRQTFFMSNMSPQLKGCNNGIWKELEETVRDWGYKEEYLYIVSGPIFNRKYPKQIGQNKISVPDQFFKVILDIEGKEKKGIAFIIDNGISERLLSEYAVSIDEAEEITGLDFYGNLLDDEIELELESDIDLKKWKFSKKRFDLRVKSWNKQ